MTDEPLDGMELARRLRMAREQAGLSQGQVAQMLTVHRPTISEIEAGRRRVSAMELSRFGEIYDVSVTWLLATGPDESNSDVALAARALSRLNAGDLEALIELLKSLRGERRQS